MYLKEVHHRANSTITHPQTRPLSPSCSNPLLPYPSRTRALPTNPQDTLLLPHHYHCLPCPLPYIPTPTSDSDVPLAPATIPPAASRHWAQLVHPTYVAPCAHHLSSRIAKMHSDDLSAFLPGMAALLFCHIT